jgi:hypothetical protein
MQDVALLHETLYASFFGASTIFHSIFAFFSENRLPPLKKPCRASLPRQFRRRKKRGAGEKIAEGA